MSALDKLEAQLTPARRLRVYRIAQAALLVLAIQQVVTADDATGYLQALGIALGIAPTELAARNTPA